MRDQQDAALSLGAYQKVIITRPSHLDFGRTSLAEREDVCSGAPRYGRLCSGTLLKGGGG